MNIFLGIIIVLCFAVGSYFVDGGFAENAGSLYKQFKQSKLSFREFMRLLFRR